MNYYLIGHPYKQALCILNILSYLFINSCFHEGQGRGFDLELVDLISNAVGIPVIASSGAGSQKHFSEVFLSTGASAALAAGIFHRQEV